MSEVTNVEIIGEAKGGATVRLKATIDGKACEGEMRVGTGRMLTPIFSKHRDDIIKQIKASEIAKYVLVRFKED